MSRLPQLLPYHPKPKPDELLSSWLIRIVNNYRMEMSDFLDLLGMSSYLHSSYLDRLAPDLLVEGLCEITGTGLEVARQTILTNRVRLLHTDKVQIETVAWPWLIPIGRSRRFGRTSGYQVCPICLASDQPYIRWQWALALFACCQTHRTLLADSCPRCGSSIHGSPQGLLGARRTLAGTVQIQLERCIACGFDFRKLIPTPAPQPLLGYEAADQEQIAEARQGSETSDHYAVLRHLITLLFGENRGLENLRRVVARRSGVARVDVPVPYEPDPDIVPFEEATSSSRARVSLAAHWLFREWPSRFIKCCREAQVEYPALNRNAVRIRWYCEAATVAYSKGPISQRKHPGRESLVSVESVTEEGTA